MSSVTVINDSQFESEVLQADLPVLVYLWAAWCGPCRLVSPSIDWIANNYGDRVKVVQNGNRSQSPNCQNLQSRRRSRHSIIQR